jgi:Tol biopolymer transport system component
MPRNRVRPGAAALVTLFGSAAVLGVSSATATGSGLGGRSQEGRFQIAWTHSNGPWNTNGEIFVMNADGSGQRNLSRHPAHDFYPAWSPDGRKIAFLSRRDGRLEIYVVNADGTGLRRLTNSPRGEYGPTWSPDGRKIAFLRLLRQRGELYVMNADGSGERRLVPRNGTRPIWSFSGAAWSPDGRMLAFSTKRNGSFDVYVINADGTGERNLTHNPANDYFHTWLPGRRIVFSSDRDGTGAKAVDNRLYLMNADGSGLRNLSREWGPGHWGSPTPVVAWSPSGGQVIFASSPNNNGSLYVMNADGSGRRKLVERMKGDEPPVWSPDGRRIAFLRHLGSWERGSVEIFVVNVDGSGLQRLTRRPWHDDSPVWSPVRTA